MIVHLLIRTETRPPAPEKFLAICEYVSENKREFSKDHEGVTCERCIRMVEEMEHHFARHYGVTE